MPTNIYLTNTDAIASIGNTKNEVFIDVIGNKGDASSIDSNSSIISILRYIVENLNTDSDVLNFLGALTTPAHTGTVDNSTTVMGYLKQVVTDFISIKGVGYSSENLVSISTMVNTIDTNIGSGSGDTIKNLHNKLGNLPRSLTTLLGSKWNSSGSLGTDITTLLSDIGNFSGQINLTSLLSVLGVPDVAGKDLYTCLITDRLDNTNFGLSNLKNLLDSIILNTTKPPVDNTDNNNISDVIGNKSDTSSGTTIVAFLKKLLAYGSGIYTTSLPANIPSTSLASYIASGGTSLGTPLATGKSIIDVLGSDGSTITDKAETVLGIMGANNTSNAFTSSQVTSDADGSIIERLEYIQSGLEGTELILTSEITSSSIPNNTQTAEIVNNVTGDLLIEELLFQTDSTGLAGPTNINISTNNVYGLTGVSLPIATVPTTALSGNNNVNNSGFSLYKLPFILEAGKSLFISGDDAVGTGVGKAKLVTKARRLSSGSIATGINI